MNGKALLIVALAGAAWWAWRVTTKQNNALDALLVEGKLMQATIQGTPASSMRLSAAGLQAIADREGFSPRKYPDASGYSIGYGHFIKPGEGFAEPMSKTTALALLDRDAEIAQDAVRAYVEVSLTQGQFDALTSFVFNVGVGAFKKSTMLRLLNAGDYAGAAAQFPRWNQSGSAVLQALVNRRAAEQTQFLA